MIGRNTESDSCGLQVCSVILVFCALFTLCTFYNGNQKPDTGHLPNCFLPRLRDNEAPGQEQAEIKVIYVIYMRSLQLPVMSFFALN